MVVIFLVESNSKRQSALNLMHRLCLGIVDGNFKQHVDLNFEFLVTQLVVRFILHVSTCSLVNICCCLVKHDLKARNICHGLINNVT